MFGIGYSESEHGPIFTREADMAAHEFCNDLEDKLVDKTVDELHKEFDIHFRHPTGYYKSQVHARGVGDDRIVDDGGVIYGPWLEGVGSRNAPVTRFKGYSSFRRVAQRIDREAEHMGNRLLRTKWLRRMG